MAPHLRVLRRGFGRGTRVNTGTHCRSGGASAHDRVATGGRILLRADPVDRRRRTDSRVALADGRLCPRADPRTPPGTRDGRPRQPAGKRTQGLEGPTGRVTDTCTRQPASGSCAGTFGLCGTPLATRQHRFGAIGTRPRTLWRTATYGLGHIRSAIVPPTARPTERRTYGVTLLTPVFLAPYRLSANGTHLRTG